MNDAIHINTIELLNRECNFIHILFINSFRIIKPIRNKYKLSVNNIMVLIACYVYHKYEGSIFNLHGIYKILGYFNRNRLLWYVNNLCLLGYLSKETKGKAMYYKLSFSGLQVCNDFEATYNSQLSAWLQSHKIDL